MVEQFSFSSMSGDISAAGPAPSSVPLLSLCLPTYKRALLLREALDAVLSQIGPEQAALVEVVVLDNASPDDTPSVVADAGQRWPLAALRSVRHAENIGMDANFLQAIEQAQGQFVCLLSDDDILLPGAVAKLLSVMQAQPDLDGVCLNVRSFFHSRDEMRVPWLKITEDTIIRSPDEVLRLMKDSVGYISILAFRKARIANRLDSGDYRERIGTYFLESYVFIDVIACGNGVAMLAQPLVAQHIENVHAGNYFQVFITELHAILAYAQHLGFSPAVIRGIETENLVGARHFVSRVMIYGRETELWSSRRDAIARLFRVYKFTPYLWLVVVPLMFFPHPLRPVVFFVRRLLGRPNVDFA